MVLPAPLGADQADHPAGRELQGQVGQDGAGLIGEVDALDREQGLIGEWFGLGVGGHAGLDHRKAVFCRRSKQIDEEGRAQEGGQGADGDVELGEDGA